MRSSLSAVLGLVSVFAIAGSSAAQIVDVAPIGGKGVFQDTRTGYLWMDFAQFYGMTYSQQVSHLLPGFSVASLSQVYELTTHSMPLSSTAVFQSYMNIVDARNVYGRDLIWGNYFTSSPELGWYYAFSYDSSWQYRDTNTADPATFTYPDNGMWAVNVAPTVTPEPVSMALLGTGLAGVAGAARRRRKQADQA